MGELRSLISRYAPKALLPFGRRTIRRLEKARGYLSIRRRPGVVLMLHVGRCGSTVLARMLAQNPRIYWDGKLHRMARRLYGDTKHLDWDLAWTRRQFRIAGSRFYGFEFKILQDQYPAILGTTTRSFLQQCKSIGVTHYVLLVRRNTLRHVVSHYAAKNSGRWHLSGSSSAHHGSFAIDVDHITTGSAPGRPLLDYIQEVENAHAEVRAFLSDQDLLELEYEADIDEAGAESAYRRVCAFLGIDATAVEVRNRRVNPFPLADIVENYDEIARRLQDTQFEWMLERRDSSGTYGKR